MDERKEDIYCGFYDIIFSRHFVVLVVLNTATRSERVVAAKEAEVSAVVSMWEPPPEPGLENSSSIIADSAAVALGSGWAPHGSGVAREFKPVGGFDKDASAAAATEEEAPVWKVSSKDAEYW